MTNELYNLHTDGDEYRITKFIDGEVASSYLLSETECDCPAGHHFTCRHRKMLPLMLAENICNQPWFMQWHGDGQYRITDFNGEPFSPMLLTEAEGPLKTEPSVPAGPEFDPAPRKPWRRI